MSLRQYKDRLNKLADFIEKLNDDQLDISLYFKANIIGKTDKNRNVFGEPIPSCVMGWATTIFKEEGLRRSSDIELNGITCYGYGVNYLGLTDDKAIQEFFGLTKQESSLFVHEKIKKPKDFARELRKLAESRTENV